MNSINYHPDVTSTPAAQSDLIGVADIGHVTDAAILKVTVKIMAYSLKHFNQKNYLGYDTYANLLCKAGKRKAAIEWQEKAAKILPGNKKIAETMNKMKKVHPDIELHP